MYFFKNTLNIFLDNVEDAIGFNQAKFQIKVKEKCHFVFESDIIAQNEFDLKGEIETFDDFYIRGKDISYTSERVFKLFYIRLIAEKLGGEFNICIEQDPAMKLTAEWIFPIVKTEKIKNNKWVKIHFTKADVENMLNKSPHPHLLATTSNYCLSPTTGVSS